MVIIILASWYACPYTVIYFSISLFTRTFPMFAQCFRQILPRVTTNSASRVSPQIMRRYAIKSRIDLLNSIYRPALASLKKGSPEYADSARSGRVWENFKPGNVEHYLQAQSDLKQTLTSIDELKEWYQENDKAKITVLRALVPECAQKAHLLSKTIFASVTL